MEETKNLGSEPSKDETFHGGFVRDRGEGRGVRVAGPKPQDLAHINQEEALARLELNRDLPPRTFPKRASQARDRKTKLAVMGLSAALLDAGDPRYAQCMRLANAYRKARTREMCVSYGYVSSGVSALLSAAAMALASSRFIYETAASPETDESGRVNKNAHAALLKTASSLSDSARQNELSAWELCAREAVIRKRNESASQALPWLTASDGAEKKPRGRPRKDAKVQQGAEDGAIRLDSEKADGEEPGDRGSEEG